jgi:hypothetical protein
MAAPTFSTTRVPADVIEYCAAQYPAANVTAPLEQDCRMHAGCKHPLAIKLVGKDGPNKGRPFWSCGRKQCTDPQNPAEGECVGSFFGWADGNPRSNKAGGGDGGGTHLQQRGASGTDPAILMRLDAIDAKLDLLLSQRSTPHVNVLGDPLPRANPVPAMFASLPKANGPSSAFAAAQHQAFGAAASSQPMDA